MAALVTAFAASGCKQEAVFTRVPAQGTVPRDAKPSPTTIFLSVPVTLDRFLVEAEKAIPQHVAPIKAIVEDAACDKRKHGWVECANARFEGELQRDGQIGLKLVDGQLQIEVPLRFAVTARGFGWAAYLNETKTGSLTVGLPIETALTAGYTLEARLQDEIVWSERTIQLLKGRVALKGIADTRLKTLMKPLTDVLRQSLAEQPIREAAARAWRGLHTPIELTRQPGLWLRGAPERLASGGFAVERGEIVHRIAITTRVSAHHGERPAPLHAKPMPEPVRLAQTGLKTEIRLPIDMSLAETQKALAGAFPKGEKIETSADKSEPAVVEVRGAELFPARERMGVALRLDIVSPRPLAGLTGKAYFLGTPAFNASSGELELTQIGFPPAPPNGIATPAPATKQPDLVKLGEEPFAGRIARTVKVDIGREIRNLLPRINAMIEQRLEENLYLGGSLETFEITTIDPGRDSLKVNLDLSGALTLRLGPATFAPGRLEQTQAGSVRPPEPTARR